MAKRNMNQRDAMTMARETGRAAKRRSSLEVRAEELLVDLGLSFTRCYPFGRFVGDFYLPEFHTVVEVYGPLHRTRPDNVARDIERARLAKTMGLGLIILSDLDQHRWWKLLQDGISKSGI